MLLQDFTAFEKIEMNVSKKDLLAHRCAHPGQPPSQSLQRRAHLDFIVDVSLEESFDFAEVKRHELHGYLTSIFKVHRFI